MALLNREQILEARETLTEIVTVEGWGGDVIVSTMSGFARDKFEATIVGKSGGVNTTNMRAKVVAASVVDESGKLLFSEKDIVKLGKKSAKDLDKVYAVATRLSGISDSDVEDLAKN